MKVKRRLDDRYVKALKPQAKSYDEMDPLVPSFGVRVTPNGTASYILYTRFPGSTSPTRRVIGRCGRMGLAEARDVARSWLADIGRGIFDPRQEKRAAQAAAEAAKRNTVRAAIIACFKAKATLKTARQLEMGLEREMTRAGWMDRAVTEITSRDIRELIIDIRNTGQRTRGRWRLLPQNMGDKRWTPSAAFRGCWAM